MRRIVLVLAVIGALGVLAGCTPASSIDSRQTLTGSVTPTPVDQTAAIDLVGLWQVTDAEGEQPGTWLRLYGSEFDLLRTCGNIRGAWDADSKAFLANPYGASQGCVTARHTLPEVPWLMEATSYERSGDGWRLSDDGGNVLAVLSRVDVPSPAPTGWSSEMQVPPISDELRTAMGTPAPLPDDLTPADPSSLIGAWVPATGPVRTPAGVTFVADGTFRASDGCNRLLSRWTMPSRGRLLALGGPMTDIGCDGVLVPQWVYTAAHAGFDGDTLVLVDHKGRELGRLVRA